MQRCTPLHLTVCFWTVLSMRQSSISLVTMDLARLWMPRKASRSTSIVVVLQGLAQVQVGKELAVGSGPQPGQEFRYTPSFHLMVMFSY